MLKREEKLLSLIKSYLSSLSGCDRFCENCSVRGFCCSVAMQKSNGDVVGLRNLSCKYLNKSGFCDIFNNRHNIIPQCKPIAEAILHRAVPSECEYVKGLNGYIGKIFVSEGEEKELIDKLIKTSDPNNLPEFLPDFMKELIKKYAKK